MIPIRSQKEADETLAFLIKTTADTLKISMDEAERRCKRLFKSGILDLINPLEESGQLIIDMFLAIPSRDHDKVLSDVEDFVKAAEGVLQERAKLN